MFRIIHIIALIFSINLSFAAGEPLIVGIDPNAAPFANQTAGNVVYGFDVDMMNSLCILINRICQYRMMSFDQLLPAVASGSLDVALSSFTITAERAQSVNFTIPYLLSYSRFLTRTPLAVPTFTMADLNNKNIGVESGSVYPTQIQTMDIQNPNLISYQAEDDMIEALSQGSIDYALMDQPAAMFWQSQSTGILSVVGPVLSYGSGVGIAVNKSQTEVLNQLNQAIVIYQNNNDFTKNYNKYLLDF